MRNLFDTRDRDVMSRYSVTSMRFGRVLTPKQALVSLHRQGATGVPAAASAWEGPAPERSDRRAAIPAQQAAKGIRPLAPDAATPPQPPRTTNPEPTDQAKRAAKGIRPLAPDAATPKPRLLASRRPLCSLCVC